MIPAVASVSGGSRADFVMVASNRAVPGPDTQCWVYALPFSYNTGFGTTFSAPTPASFSSKQAGNVGFGPSDGAAGLQYPNSTSVGGTGSNISTWAFSASGWGSQYSAPATGTTNGAGGSAADYQFFINPGLLALTTNQSPYIGVYPWTNASGYGTKFGNPPTAIAGSATGVTFRNQSTQAIAVSHNTTPFLTAYPWSAGFGTKYANPATLPGSNASAVKFSPDGSNLLYSETSSPYIGAYAWSSGFSTKYANPATLPTGAAGSYSLAWRGDSGADVIVGHNTTPFATAYAWSAGFGAKYANPAVLPTAALSNAQWNGDGNVVLGVGSTTSVNAWTWSNGWGTKYTDYTPTYNGVYASFNNSR